MPAPERASVDHPGSCAQQQKPRENQKVVTKSLGELRSRPPTAYLGLRERAHLTHRCSNLVFIDDPT
jgi:hypothetical protein